MAAEIHEGDIGTIFRFTVYDEDDNLVDLSRATAYSIVFKKPDCTLLTKTASLFTDGKDGIMQYMAASGDLDQVGKWSIQGIVTFADFVWNTDIIDFKVYKNVG